MLTIIVLSILFGGFAVGWIIRGKWDNFKGK